MQTSSIASYRTSDKQHAIFCERQFAMELFRRIRIWRLAGKLVKR